MKQTLANQDITETLGASEPLEDDIFLQMEKIDALSAIRLAVDAGESAMSPRTMSYFSLVMDQEIKKLRELLDKIFP